MCEAEDIKPADALGVKVAMLTLAPSAAVERDALGPARSEKPAGF